MKLPAKTVKIGPYLVGIPNFGIKGVFLERGGPRLYRDIQQTSTRLDCKSETNFIFRFCAFETSVEIHNTITVIIYEPDDKL